MPETRLFRIVSAKWHPIQGGSDIDATPVAPPGAATPETTSSGVWGGGFQNTAAINPTLSNLWLTAGDVAGVHLSDDGGMSWTPNNTGLDSPLKMHGVAVRWSETDPYLAYYFSSATGSEGNANNFLFSGRYDPELGVIVKWEIIRQVNGAWCQAGIPTTGSDATGYWTLPAPDMNCDHDGHPRQTKRRMIALDEANGVAYLGSYDGLWRQPLDGLTAPVRVWGANQCVTSISLDPQNKNIAYVTVDVGSLTGVHRLTTIRTGTNPTVATFRPADLQYAQSCKAVVKAGSTVLFVATGKLTNSATPTGSVYFWPGGTFTTGWVDITGTLNADETNSGFSSWAGLDAVLLTNGNYRLIVSHSHKGSFVGKKQAWSDWTGAGTPAWTKVSSSNVDQQYRVGDNTGSHWWFQDSFSSLMLDRVNWNCVDPGLAQSNPDIQVAPGRSGIWRRTVNGEVDSLWHPAVKGTAVTTSQDVLVSNQNPKNIAFGDTDWRVLRSTDGGVSQPLTWPLATSGNGWVLAQAENSGQIAICMGDRDNNDTGFLYTSNNFWSDTPTLTEQLRTGSGGPWTTTSDTPQCKGAAIGVNLQGTQVILAALRGIASKTTPGRNGLFRKQGNVWAPVSLSPYPTGEVFQTSNNSIRWRFAWQPHGGATIWLSDPVSGLWQSRDYGLTWTSFYPASWTNSNSGYIVGDPTRVGVYYATTRGTESWKITNGNGTTPTKTPLNPDAHNPMAVVVHPSSGDIYMAETGEAKLWVSRDGGTNWNDITTASWQAMCSTVKAMAIGSNGAIYTAMFAGYAITGLRDPIKQPFASSSPWNTAIGSGASMISAGLGASPGTKLKTDEIFIGLNKDDPLLQLKEANFANGSPVTPGYVFPSSPIELVHVPTGMSHGGQWNGIGALLRSDNRYVWQGQPMYLRDGTVSSATDTGATAGPRWANSYPQPSGAAPTGLTDLYGNGIAGSHGGGHLGGLGGALRAWEWYGNGHIQHVLGLNVYSRKYLSKLGTPAGYRWPAVKADSSFTVDQVGGVPTNNYYGGTIVDVRMGSLLCLPASFDLSTITDLQAKRLAWTLQNYGCYIVDNSGINEFYAISAETSIVDDISNAGGNFHSQMLGLLPSLMVVTNNASDAVSGGGTPRVAPLLEITP